MRLDLGSRLANYVTLALACACLLNAESLFLPGIGWFLPLVWALMFVAFFLEGRRALSAWAASLLALLITIGYASGIVYLLRRDPDSFIAAVPLPVALVPYAGPWIVV